MPRIGLLVFIDITCLLAAITCSNGKQFCFSRHFSSSLNWQYCDKSQYSKCTFNNTFPNHLTTQSNGNTNTATRYWINKKQHVFPFTECPTLRIIHSYLCLTISFWIYLYTQFKLCRYTGKHKLTKQPVLRQACSKIRRTLHTSSYHNNVQLLHPLYRLTLTFASWFNRRRHEIVLPAICCTFIDARHSNCLKYSNVMFGLEHLNWKLASSNLWENCQRENQLTKNQIVFGNVAKWWDSFQRKHMAKKRPFIRISIGNQFFVAKCCHFPFIWNLTFSI